MQIMILNTSKVFIHSLSAWSFGFPNILESTLRAVNNVNQVVEFTSDLIFRG